jgi:heme exporter protein A
MAARCGFGTHSAHNPHRSEIGATRLGQSARVSATAPTQPKPETAPRSATPAIELDSLRRDFDDRPVLRDVSLHLAPGATLAVLGANGAGKTTLLRVLATLLRPTAGTARILGRELPREAWRVRGHVGYLAHEPLLYRDLTLAEALAFHARLHGLGDRGPARIAELLESVKLARAAGELVRNLSAGMLQRAAACRAVLHEPELLLLDEPAAHLDPAAAELVSALLGPAPGRARVVVSHDVEGALAGADRALALRPDGSVAYEGPAAGLSPGDARAIYAGRA